MTPRETWLTIDAVVWRDDRSRRLATITAWQTAALSRAKKMPSLKSLLYSEPAKPLAGAELQKRRQEHKQMTANLNTSKLTEKLRKHGL